MSQFNALTTNNAVSEEFIDSLSSKERDVFSRILTLAHRNKQDRSRAEQIREIVPIRKWINDPFYVGEDYQSIYPYWQDVIVEAFEKPYKYNEIIIDGAIGIGKSLVSEICVLRKVYELSCWKNVQSLFGMMSTAFVSIFYFSVTKQQAEATGFGNIKARFDTVPYFEKEFPREKDINSMVVWPQQQIMFMFGSNPSHSIGMNMICSVMDEANFVGGDTDQKNQQQTFNKAAHLYNNSRRRAKSRFVRGGIDHSLALIVSSSTHATSFTAERKRLSLNDPTVLAVNARLWDVKPEGTFSEQRFWVFTGSDLVEPMIINTIEDINGILVSIDEPLLDETISVVDAIQLVPSEYREKFVDVPENYRKEFQNDVVSSLQDIAGISVSPVGRLFSARTLYLQAVSSGEKKGLRHPFLREEASLPTGDETQLQDIFNPEFRFRKPEQPRFVHIDQSISQDSTGIAMLHIDHVKEIGQNKVPHFSVDFMLRIKPPVHPRQISISKIRDFLFYLQEVHRINFGKVTYDTYNSADSLQILESKNINCGTLSVDRDDEAYTSLVSAFLDGRIDLYSYKPFYEELFGLIHDKVKRKVDHPADGCFTGDTRVKLLDGSNPTFKELAEGLKGDSFWVYSVLPDGTPVPALAKSARLTKNVSVLVEVEIDNGEKIKCTPEHLFMLRDGTYKEAQNLRSGDSLMPLYFKFKGQHGMKGYERILNNKSKRWEMTHAWVSRFFGFGVLDFKLEVIHHRNFSKIDNTPNNLEKMTRQDHFSLHSKIGYNPISRAKGVETYKKRYYSDPEMRERRKVVANSNWNKLNASKMWTFLTRESRQKAIMTRKENGEDFGRNFRDWNISQEGRELSRNNSVLLNDGYWKSDEGINRRNELKESRKENLEKHRRLRIEKEDLEAIQKIEKFLPYLLSYRHAMRLAGGGFKTWERRLSKKIDFALNAERVRNLPVEEALQLTGLEKESTLKLFVERASLNNHKVVSVSFFNEEADVYDLEVPEYHNFSLSCGVFVHNSKDVTDGVAGALKSALSAPLELSYRESTLSAFLMIAREDEEEELFSLADL